MNNDPIYRLDEFEVVWTSGYIDRIKASQVSYTGGESIFNPGYVSTRFVNFHGMIEGSWTLVLTAREEEIQSVRNLSQAGELAS